MTYPAPKYSPTITKETLSTLPLRAFDGDVCILTKPQEVTNAFREIAPHEVVGFDTETRPSFRKGEYHHVALMQLAIPGKVFLIRLNQTKVTNQIIYFLEDNKIIKAGVGLHNDINALNKLCPFKPSGFVEIASIAKTIGLQVEGLKKLAGIILGFRVSKSAQISNWEAVEYTEKQICYAATDAWVCLSLYKKLIAELKQSVALKNHKY